MELKFSRFNLPDLSSFLRGAKIREMKVCISLNFYGNNKPRMHGKKIPPCIRGKNLSNRRLIN